MTWESRRRNADHAWRLEREEAEEAPCEYCGAKTGEHCTNPTTGDVINAPAHPVRLKTKRSPDA